MNPKTDERPLLDILRCARPILFVNESKEWPVSNGGTAFVVVYHKRHFVITAKHCLNQKNFNPEQFRIQYRPDAGDFIPLQNGYVVSGVDADDTDQYDVAVWDVHEDDLQPKLFGEYSPYTLLAIDSNTLFNPNAAYLYRGYPICERSYDPEKRAQDQPSVSSRAEYVRRTEVAGLHELRLATIGSLKSLDGFSGSPVFQVTNDAGKYSREAFAGMLLRGTAESRRVYMLEHRHLIDVLFSVDVGAVQPAPVKAPAGPAPPGASGA
jgi:hypothetical protein